MRTRSLSDTSVSQITKAGEQLYQTKLKGKLEPRYKGQYVVIEPESGDYFIGQDPHKANQEAQKKYPEKVFYLKKIGYDSAFSFPHSISAAPAPNL